MKVATGTVLEGRVEVPAEFAADGMQVVVLALESGPPILLSPADEEELSEAAQAIARGDFVDGDTLLAELRSLRA